ncbi:MAG: hypothetical protein H0U60_19595 [Blastocatellia bacterium]|nr:hypothetical protein [Blastocatellia bacterium]
MLNITTQIKNAIARAKFDDPDIEAATLNAIEKLDAELFEAGYDQGPQVDGAVSRLEDTLTLVDTAKEEATTEDEDEDEDDSEFGGFQG